MGAWLGMAPGGWKEQGEEGEGGMGPGGPRGEGRCAGSRGRRG
jgi:hypothetical protein